MYIFLILSSRLESFSKLYQKHYSKFEDFIAKILGYNLLLFFLLITLTFINGYRFNKKPLICITKTGVTANFMLKFIYENIFIFTLAIVENK